MTCRRLLFGPSVLMAATLAAIAGCGPSAPAAPPTAGPTPQPVERVTAASPQRKTIRLTTTQPGQIQAFEQTPLVAKISGYVEKVLVDIGDHVQQGQTLVKIAVPEMLDDLAKNKALVVQSEAELRQAEAAIQGAKAAVRSMEARVSQAEAGIVRSQGEHERWRAEHARMKELAANRSVTQKLVDETLDQLHAAEAAHRESLAGVQSAQAALEESRVGSQKAEADRSAADARRLVAKANLARTETMLHYTEIKAPFDGVVTRRSVDTGHFVTPAGGDNGQPLLIVCQTDVVRVFVDVPELEAERVDAGEHGDAAVVRVQALGGKTFDAKVTRTAWSLDPTNRSLRTEIDVINSEAILRPGMFATATILLDERPNVLALPATAIVRDGPDHFCWTVEGGKLERRKIEIGLRSGNDVEVSAGLALDQVVVSAPSGSLKPGQPVEIITPEKK